jgi:SAM-dependent methyltransferase
MSDSTSHWNKVYRNKRFDEVSWYAPHLAESLRLITELAPRKNASIIDVGGGESTLVDDLLDRGYQDVSVLDISAAAIEFTKERLGPRADTVHWYTADITHADFGGKTFDLWHDRAVFHFLTDAASREAYVARVKASVRRGGFVVMATFGPEGPVKCSGLDVVRYDSEALHSQFGDHFRLLGAETQQHATPAGGEQQFLYCWCRVD